VLLEGLGKLKNFILFIGSQTRDPSAYSIISQPLRYRVPLPCQITSSKCYKTCGLICFVSETQLSFQDKSLVLQEKRMLSLIRFLS
jgi:hypothetical protein